MKYLMFGAADPDHTAADAEAAPDVEDWLFFDLVLLSGCACCRSYALGHDLTGGG